MGEEALRKLATHAYKNTIEDTNDGTVRLSSKQKRKRLWLETMEAVIQDHTAPPHTASAFPRKDDVKSKDSELLRQAILGSVESAVNADKKYWRKPVS